MKGGIGVGKGGKGGMDDWKWRGRVAAPGEEAGDRKKRKRRRRRARGETRRKERRERRGEVFSLFHALAIVPAVGQCGGSDEQPDQ